MIVFISITIIFIFNIIRISKVTYFYWFNCLLFLTHKICWYLELFCLFFYCLIFFFKSKKISDILHCDVSFFFFYLLLFSSRSGIIHILSKLLDICDIIFLPYTVSGRRFLGDSTQYASPWTGSQICHLFNVCL